ncbi:MAG: hypothetical protein R3251_01425 [Candidatus Spechtbacterales bacterium]|nr:hypothetical protein [Candidatus Spechtbacterales bacterium]
MEKYFKKQEGLVALSFAVIAMFVGMVIIISFVFVFLNRIEASRNLGMGEQAYFAAESGIEDVLLRFLDSSKSQASTYPYMLSVGSANATVTVKEIIGNNKEIIADGVRSSRSRRVYVILNVDSDAVSFLHGAQVGDGGLTMANGSSVVGSVFSNGGIQGTNQPDITGDAFAAGLETIDDVDVGANAQAGTISNTDVTGEARADILSECDIGGDAYYDTSITNCTAAGNTTQESYAQLSNEPMPIPDSKIDEWKQEAENGGVINTCDGSGDYIPADQEVIGAVKIECNLVINGNKEVFVGGYVWVEGDVSVLQNSILRLDPSFGPLSSAVIADHPGNPGGRGLITVGNNASIEGSGSSSSYLMMISMNSSAEGGGGSNAINIQNGSSSSIFYAPHGRIVMRNNVFLVEVTAYELELENSATVQYEQGLDDLQFSAGASGGYSISTWEEQ